MALKKVQIEVSQFKILILKAVGGILNIFIAGTIPYRFYVVLHGYYSSAFTVKVVFYITKKFLSNLHPLPYHLKRRIFHP
jgi:hypothetical protein